MCSHVVFVCDLFLGGSNAEASAIRSSNWAKWIIQFSSKMLHLLPVTKWQKGNRHKDEIQLASLSVFKVACVSSNASIRFFFDQSRSTGPRECKWRKKRQDYVRLCMFCFPLSPLSAWFVAPCSMLNVRLHSIFCSHCRSLWWLFSDLLLRGALQRALWCFM